MPLKLLLHNMDELIMLGFGIFLTLMGYGRIGKKPGLNAKYDDWFKKWGGRFRVLGPSLILIAFLMFLLGSFGAGAAQKSTVTAPDGSFKVTFPGEPKFSQDVEKSEEGAAEHLKWSLSADDGDTFYVVSCRTFSGSAYPSDSVAALRELLPTLVPKDWQMIREQPATVGKSNGLEVDFSAQGYKARMRLLALGHRLYLLEYVAHQVPTKDGEALLDSFELIKPGL